MRSLRFWGEGIKAKSQILKDFFFLPDWPGRCSSENSHLHLSCRRLRRSWQKVHPATKYIFNYL